MPDPTNAERQRRWREKQKALRERYVMGAGIDPGSLQRLLHEIQHRRKAPGFDFKQQRDLLNDIEDALAGLLRQPPKPKGGRATNSGAELEGWSAQAALDFLRSLRRTIAEKRAAAKAERIRRNWNPDAVLKLETLKLIEWIEAELGKLPGIVGPRNGSGVWDFVWSLRQGITKGKATARVPPRRGLRQNSIDDFIQPELLKLVDWIEAELDKLPSPRVTHPDAVT